MSDHERCARWRASFDPGGADTPSLLDIVTSSHEAPDLTGEWIGRYVIGRVLGQGGMGVVYEAFDTVLERTVALKILVDDLGPPALRSTLALKLQTADGAPPEELVREAQLAAALAHEHIVPVYEVGEHQGITYFTMMRVDGGPLSTPAPDERRAAEIALAIARAVLYAHQHGILHRDLKPANVLMDKTGRPFVTDFGLAAREGLAAAPGGTPLYMAPEVWRREPGAVSTRADVWSAGVILYELLTGHPPFDAPSEAELMRKVIAEDPPALADVHPDLAAVCLKCLEKDPARRYPAVGLVADLERFLAGEPVGARPLGLGARGLRRLRRHPVMTLLSVVLFAVALRTIITELSLTRANAAALRAKGAALHAADFAARRAAHFTALQFDGYRAALEHAGRDPRVVGAASDPASPRGTEVCSQLLAERAGPTAGPFATWFLLDRDGMMIGRAPEGIHEIMGRSFRFRDYFRGVEELERAGRRAAYVSRAYRSEGDDDYEIAIAIAVHDAKDRWIGLLSATIPTGSALGSLELDDADDEGLSAALLAPRGPERGDRVTNPEPLFILHRALRRGAELPARDDDGFGADPGAGAFMRIVPVRGTPFSVVVRVGLDRPLALEARLRL